MYYICSVMSVYILLFGNYELLIAFCVDRTDHSFRVLTAQKSLYSRVIYLIFFMALNLFMSSAT